MKLFSLFLGLFLVGCNQPGDVRVVNQCLRTELFQQCLKAVPQGPQATKYNDWDEVISECKGEAYYSALRFRKFVPEECQAE